MTESQTDRLLRWLRANPGASGMEIVMALHMTKYTSRISDLRAAGNVIDAWRSTDGVWRYRLVEQPVQLAAFG